MTLPDRPQVFTTDSAAITRFNQLNVYLEQAGLTSQLLTDGANQALNNIGPLLDVKLTPTLSAANSAVTQALMTLGINPTYISQTSTNPPLGPDGTYGSRRDTYGLPVTLKVVSGAWVQVSEPLLTAPQLSADLTTAYISADGSDTRGYVGREFSPFKTLAAALTALSALPTRVLRLRDDTFAAPDPSAWLDRLTVRGVRRGQLTSDRTAIFGGTIIKGHTRFPALSNLILEDLAFDAGPAAVTAGAVPAGAFGAGNNALEVSTYGTGAGAASNIQVRRILALAKDPAALYHAALFEGITDSVFEDIQTSGGVHGAVFKVQDSSISKIRAKGHAQNGVIIKSSPPYNALSSRNTISDVRVRFLVSPGDTGGIRFQSTEGGNQGGVTLTDFNVYGTTFGLSFDAVNESTYTGSTNNDLVISHGVIDAPTAFGVQSSGPLIRTKFIGVAVTASLGNGWQFPTGTMDVSLLECSSDNAATNGLLVSGNNVRVIGGRYKNSAAADISNSGSFNTADLVDAPVRAGTAMGTLGGGSTSSATFRTAFTDDFDRADGSLGAAWVTRLGTPVIASNAATRTGGTDTTAIVNDLVFTDGVVEADLRFNSGLSYRTSPNALYRYLFLWQGDGRYALATITNGSYAALWTSSINYSGADPGYKRRFRVEVSGSTHKLYINGALQTTVTDGTFTSGDVGIFLAGGSVDSFSVSV